MGRIILAAEYRSGEGVHSPMEATLNQAMLPVKVSIEGGRRHCRRPPKVLPLAVNAPRLRRKTFRCAVGFSAKRCFGHDVMHGKTSLRLHLPGRRIY